MKTKTKRISIIALLIIAIMITAGILIVRYILDEAEYKLKLSNHPLGFSELVEKYANEYNLDKFLVYAVIKTESSFNPRAVSSAGARGLMQIMEETFDWINYRLDEDLEYALAFDEEVNIRYGCYLLFYNLRLYEGDLNCAAAAYHAGSGDVSRWLLNEQYSNDGKTLILEKIPIPETRHYVNKINNAYNTYKEIYGGQINGR